MAFPSTVLDLAAELGLSGTWTDITSYVYQRDDPAPVTITRGRPDEAAQTEVAQAAFQVNNRSGDFTPLNPSGAHYGQIGRNTPVRFSVPAQAVHLRLEDDTASYASTPDSAGLSITGDTEIQLDLQPSTYAATILAAKYDDSGAERSWLLELLADGTVTFSWSADGTTLLSATSTAVLPLGRIALKVTLDVNNGAAGNTVTFYTAATIAGSWTQLGDAVTQAGTTSVFDSTAAVTIGHPASWSGTTPGMSGRVYAFRLLSGIAGTTEASPDFTAQSDGATSFADAQANTWTVHGTAAVSGRSYRFHGEMAGWPQRWDKTGTDVWVPVAAAGIRRRLGQGTAPLNSALYRGYVRLTGTGAPVAYWPCEDGENATRIASALGAPPVTITGTATMASDSAFACSSPIPLLSHSIWRGTIPDYTQPGTPDNVFRFLLDVPSGGGVNGTVIVRLYTTGTVATVSLHYTTGGGLQLIGYDADGNSLFDTGAVAFAVNGEHLRVGLALRTSGSDVEYEIQTLQPGAAAALATSGTLSSASVGKMTGFTFNPDNGTGAGTADDIGIGHISAQSTWTTLFDLADVLNAWQGETAAARFARLCSEENIACRVYGYPDNTVAMGAQLPKSLTDLLQEAEDADRGMLYEPRDSLSLGYRTRRSLENQDPAVTLSYTSADLGDDDLQPTDDDQRTVNDVTVTRANGGSSSRQVLTTGPLSTAAPPDGVGTYDTAAEISLYTDDQADDAAGWILHIGTVNEPRYPAVPVSLARTAISGDTTKYYGCQDADIGGYVAITSPPAWLPPGDIKQLIAGMTEILGGYHFKITWQCVPESPYELAIVEDAVLGRVATDGSTLDSDATSGATSLSVASSGTVWSTDGADVPFGIIIGGEEITVTAISSATSPQTFTVTRAVNGVVKAHTAGDVVALYQTPTAAL